jgi:hypothetical protein
MDIGELGSQSDFDNSSSSLPEPPPQTSFTQVQNENQLGVRRLWGAVLARALSDLLSKGREHDDVLAWFKNDVEEPGSFKWICEELGLDPKYILWRVGLD